MIIRIIEIVIGIIIRTVVIFIIIRSTKTVNNSFTCASNHNHNHYHNRKQKIMIMKMFMLILVLILINSIRYYI